MAILAFNSKRLIISRAIGFALVALGAVFVMNSIRIALLLYIGIHISEEVAVGGFHSYFGTISLLAVVGIALLALQLPFFEKSAFRGDGGVSRVPLAAHADLVPAIMPLAIMLAVSFLVGSVQGEFNWLYFIPASVGAILIWVVRERVLSEMVGGPSLTALACGVAVYFIWMALIPPNPERIELFESNFGSVTLPVMVAWLAVRVLGSSIVVPVLEELAFRAGLMRLIERLAAPHMGRGPVALVAVFLSSLAFGLMHADILAATIAGIAYGSLASWRGRIGDAIVAHAVTNFLIAIHVIALSEWSYW